MPHARTVDQNGRLSLGKAYAGQTFMVKKESDGRLVLTLGKFVPTSEAWIHENPDVQRALKESAEGAPPSQAPDLAADAELFNDEEGT